MKLLKIKTEFVLYSAIAVLLLSLVVNMTGGERKLVSVVAGEESQNEQSQEENDFEKSEDKDKEESQENNEEDEKSSKEESEDYKKEQSENIEYSEKSTQYQNTGTAIQPKTTSTPTPITNAQENEFGSVEQETPGSDVNESGTNLEEEDIYQEQEFLQEQIQEPVSSPRVIGFEEDQILSLDGNRATVEVKEKFLGIFDTEVEYMVEIDEGGNVITQNQTLWNRILSFLSF